MHPSARRKNRAMLEVRSMRSMGLPSQPKNRLKCFLVLSKEIFQYSKQVKVCKSAANVVQAMEAMTRFMLYGSSRAVRHDPPAE
ncbi:hypothetical protein POX_d05743 [Penicillium oxalicum]|uniref:hypothetical protein n=1 Tax=Penicillium oxalicum TaxID=69781 RepID=UPI0020B8F45B|nr:hypothetical protein POX_d05743 [Penicillium oxalicum]KAI2790236.1 hypothetical protein POX_d05743 [Penicillium oxalicum]